LFIVKKLIDYRRKPVIGLLSHALLKIAYGIDMPNAVQLGGNIEYIHSAVGSIIHPQTIIEDNVTLFHQVTIGRADAYVDYSYRKGINIIIKEGAVICAGAKILCKEGTLTVGRNTVVGANAVLTRSTGNNEIWGGIPAKKISDRDDIPCYILQQHESNIIVNLEP
jgi:Serine acetyltransferase